MPRLTPIALVLLCAAVAPAQVTKPATVWDESPNYTNTTRETTYNIDAVVIHTTEGTYAGAISWFNSTSSGVSAHYVISPTGAITQMVKDEDIAWHATYYNSRSIGIECAGYAASPSTWTPALLASLKQLVAWLCQEYDVPAVHGATDAYDYPDDKLAFSGVVAHSQVQPWSKSDPGAYFPWTTFMADVNALLVPPPPPPAPAGLAPAGYAAVSSPAVLSWTSMASFSVDTYYVQVEKFVGTAWTIHATAYPATPSYSVTWTGSGSFRFAVWAHNSSGWGPGSAYAYFAGLAPPVLPPAPTGLSPTGSVTKSGPSVKLTWGAVAGADSYEVYVQYYSASSGTYLYYYAWTATSPTFTYWPTVKSTWYRWRVRAHNSAGWGPWSGGASTSSSTGWAKFYFTK